MTFEEFFKKKKINLATLQQAEPALFTEFKNHYELMGEKSFDHTKKYWFNKLRRQYPAPVEPKVEKVKAENPIAEQTIVETLVDEASTAAKPAFKPRFKAPAPPKQNEPVAQINETVADVNADMAVALPPETSAPSAPKPGFKPRFQAKKPAQTVSDSTELNVQDAQPATPEEGTELPVAESPVPAAAPKPAFKPRFKPGITKSAGPATEPADKEENKTEATEAQPVVSADTSLPTAAETPAPAAAKPAFKPRFKPGITKPAISPAPENEAAPTVEPATETQPLAGDLDTAPGEPVPEAPKPAYKPRFNPKMAKPKPPADEEE